MGYKKQIVSIMTLTILLLLMMSTAIQAVSLVGNISDLKASLDGSQMKLTWSSVSNSAGYNVYVNGTKIGFVNSNEATLIGFSENTTYRLRVTAYDNTKTEVAFSNEINFTTTLPKSLEQVQNLTVTQANGYVTLNWAKVEKANKYQIFVDIPGYGDTNIGEVTTTNAVLRGFIDGQKYGFSIRACQNLNSNSVNYGEKSVAQYIVVDSKKNDTNSDSNISSKPDTVEGVSVYNIAETTASVSWTKANNADRYEVKLSKNNGKYQTVLDTAKTMIELSNLDANSYYRVKVVAYKWIDGQKKYGAESVVWSFYTLAEQITVGNVSDIYINSTTQNSANISWTSVNNATGYKIYLAQGNGSFQYQGTTASRNYVFANLKANTYYRVKMEAYRIVNGKEYTSKNSTIKGFTTAKTTNTVVKLDTVINLNAEIRNRNEAYLTWKSVQGATGYEVWVSKEGGAYQRYTWVTTNNTILTSSVLNYSTIYSIKVRAYKNQWTNTSAGTYQTIYGEFSNIVSFRTQSYNGIDNSYNIPKVTGVIATTKGTSVMLDWNKVTGAVGYEIDFTVPNSIIGHVTLKSTTNSRRIDGIVGKKYDYTARIRAYKYVNGVKQYGPYSEIVKFREN